MSTSIEYKGHIIKIETDDCPPNPRTEFDNCCKMVCFHKDYKLGDEKDYNRSDYNSWDELEKDIIKQENAVIILPLYLYDHSGITISITPFSCRWDSGQVGFVYMTRESIKNDFGIKRLTKKVLTKMFDLLGKNGTKLTCFNFVVGKREKLRWLHWFGWKNLESLKLR